MDPDIAIFIVYLAGIVLFGSSFYRKNKSSASFTLGNKNIPTWVFQCQYLPHLSAALVIWHSPDKHICRTGTHLFSAYLYPLPRIWLSPIFLTSEDLERYASPYHVYLSIVFGTMAIFIAGFIIGVIINLCRNREN